MSSPCRSLALGVAAAAVVLSGSGCDRGARGSERALGGRGMATRDTGAQRPGVEPGIHPAAVFGPMRNPYTGDAAAIATGQQLFNAFNCSGCHSGYAGGGMGPSLRDSLWTYGDSDVQLFSTIAEGRSAGMPAWGAKIPQEQIWKIIAYIRTLGTPAEPVKPPEPAYVVYRPPT